MTGFLASLLRALTHIRTIVGPYFRMTGLRDRLGAPHFDVNPVMDMAGRLFSSAWRGLSTAVASLLALIRSGIDGARAALPRFMRGLVSARGILWRWAKTLAFTTTISIVFVTLCSSVLALPLMLCPFLFAGSMFGLLDPGQVNSPTYSFSHAIVSNIQAAFVAAQHALPPRSGDALPHVLNLDWWPSQKPDRYSLARFDTLFHAVFGFCVGFGIILEVGKIATNQLDNLRDFSNEAVPTLFADDKVNRSIELQRGRRTIWAASIFAPFAKWCLRGTAFCTYVCFFVTACLAAFMLATAAVSDDKFIPDPLLPACIAFATAPFVQSIILIAIVLAIAGGCILFVRRTHYITQRVSRKMEAIQREVRNFAGT